MKNSVLIVQMRNKVIDKFINQMYPLFEVLSQHKDFNKETIDQDIATRLIDQFAKLLQENFPGEVYEISLVWIYKGETYMFLNTFEE